LQQPFNLSSLFSKISFLLNRLPLPIFQTPRQREANSTAFKPAVNTSFSASDHFDRSHQQDQTTTLSARRILLESATDATLFIRSTH
ncbi:hypothetical protein, partial [Pseudomonas kuykendallii]